MFYGEKNLADMLGVKFSFEQVVKINHAIIDRRLKLHADVLEHGMKMKAMLDDSAVSPTTFVEQVQKLRTAEEQLFTHYRDPLDGVKL